MIKFQQKKIIYMFVQAVHLDKLLIMIIVMK